MRGRVDGAKRVLSAMVGAMREDLVPRRVRSAENTVDPPSPDATLWLFEATRQLVRVVGVGDEVVRRTLYPALLRIFHRVLTPGKIGALPSRRTGSSRAATKR